VYKRTPAKMYEIRSERKKPFKLGKAGRSINMNKNDLN
jgi:hypothetical protein